MSVRVWAVALVAVLSGCTAASAPRLPYYPMRNGEPLAARVDGEPIPLRFVEQDLRLQERMALPPDLDEARRKAWEQEARRRLVQKWVDLFLVEREALRRGLAATDAEVQEELGRRGRELEDPEKVAEMRRRYGVTMDDLRIRVRQRLLIRKFNRVLVEELMRRTTEAQLRAYYRENLHLFRHPEQAYVRLVAVRDPERASRLRARAAGGEDFAQLARRYSEHFTKDRGGEWGWVSRGVREWEPVFRLRPGEVSEPFAWRGLWWVVKAEKFRGPGVQPFEEVQEQVRQMYLADRLRQEQARITQELRSRAKVEVLVR